MVTDADLGAEGPLAVYCNPAFCAMTGYCRDEWIGRSPKILQGPLSDHGVIGRLREALESAADFHGATFNYRKDGSCYLVEWNVSPVRSSEGGGYPLRFRAARYYGKSPCRTAAGAVGPGPERDP
ncbi:PAS domain-containing protein [Bordetella trematum]|uniref:PAS domain-containing protein n=1 Tax=Bordetella trematum TaxID=123899 RepID=UPI003988D79F